MEGKKDSSITTSNVIKTNHINNNIPIEYNYYQYNIYYNYN